MTQAYWTGYVAAQQNQRKLHSRGDYALGYADGLVDRVRSNEHRQQSMALALQQLQGDCSRNQDRDQESADPQRQRPIG